MLRWFVASFTALLVFLGAVWGSAVMAQTVSPTPSPKGAYESLSPGNQKIARALFEAQKTGSGGTTTAKPLTLDEIAAKKQSGEGWGRVFKEMKAQGLVHDKNLGQVVSRHRRSGSGSAYSASGRELHDGSHRAQLGARHDDDGDRHEYGRRGHEHRESDRGQAYASESGHTELGRSGGRASHGGRGGN
jgi:hypothetical protein